MTSSDHKSSDLVSAYQSLLRRPLGEGSSLGTVSISTNIPKRDNRPCAVILAPHPDDECLSGALPLRLKREQKWQIVTIALTLGSRLERRAMRKSELAHACAVLGFDAVLPREDGFSDVTETARLNDTTAWNDKVALLATLLRNLQPQALFMPHVKDAHPAHIGTHHLGIDALTTMPADFSCMVFQTEYWQPNENPNLLVGVSENDATLLLTALACHKGENLRNAFDRRFPAYLIDNVRRGAERVGGAGQVAPEMDFAVLYQQGIWKNGKYIASALGRVMAPGQALDFTF